VAASDARYNPTVAEDVGAFPDARASAPGGEVITLVSMNAYSVDFVVTSERSWKLVIGNNDSTGSFFNGKLCTAGISTR